jgi:hypothetical protein
MGQNLSQEELDFISEQSGIEDDVIKSWHKDFIKLCPTGKMVKSLICFRIENLFNFNYLG